VAQQPRVTELSSVTISEQPIRRFLLEAGELQVELMEFGATVLSVKLATPSNEWVCLTRGLAKPAHYDHNPAYMGSTCGRYSGRIAGARFSGPEGEVRLSANQGANHLHGGARGFDARVWRAEVFECDNRAGVDFYYFSEDGEEGYPGALDARVRYSIDRQNRLWIEYQATAVGQTTPVNLTNHCYWNLADASQDRAQETVLDHELQLAARSVLELDADLLPTGASVACQGTALDFSDSRTLSDSIAALPDGIDGLDHCLHDFSKDLGTLAELDSLTLVARVHEPRSGRNMVVYTDQPLLVLYTGNALTGAPEHGGAPKYGGVCIECQRFPDAPNQSGFPSAFVGQGERYEQTSVYEFSTTRVE